MTSAIQKEMLCGLRHKLQEGASSESWGLCRICCDFSSARVPAAMHCPLCKEIVCAKCLLKHKDDIGFAMFLSNESQTSLIYYEKDQKCATTRYRCHWSLGVYDLHQEYNDTDEFRENVKDAIERAERNVWKLKRKLAASEERAAKAPKI